MMKSPMQVTHDVVAGGCSKEASGPTARWPPTSLADSSQACLRAKLGIMYSICSDF